MSDNVIDSSNGSNYSWLLANGACGGPSYQSSANNTIEYNYYSANMSILKNPATNTITNNIAVSGAWDAHAQDIITCAGAGGGTVTTLRQGSYYK